MSARLRSVKAVNLKYGRVEFKAKLPKGDWLWPALWLLPTNNAYGTWPASGEIDIMESRGNSPGYSAGGCDVFTSTLHWGPSWDQNRYGLTHGEYKIPSGTLHDDFHIYGLYWDDKKLYTYIDNEN